MCCELVKGWFLPGQEKGQEEEGEEQRQEEEEGQEEEEKEEEEASHLVDSCREMSWNLPSIPLCCSSWNGLIQPFVPVKNSPEWLDRGQTDQSGFSDVSIFEESLFLLLFFWFIVGLICKEKEG